MATTFHLDIDAPEITNNCFAEIRSQLGGGNELTVAISNAKESRSQAQRRLQYAWYTQISNEQGEAVSVIRNRLMNKFAVPIFYRDNIEINGVYSADTIDAIRLLKANGMIQQYQQLMRGFVSSITSNSFTVKQNAEYLKHVDHWANDQGITLFVPGGFEAAKYNEGTP